MPARMILALGGMEEVYRAEDTNLNRGNVLSF